jgi:hypothetical protein
MTVVGWLSVRLSVSLSFNPPRPTFSATLLDVPCSHFAFAGCGLQAVPIWSKYGWVQVPPAPPPTRRSPYPVRVCGGFSFWLSVWLSVGAPYPSTGYPPPHLEDVEVSEKVFTSSLLFTYPTQTRVADRLGVFTPLHLSSLASGYSHGGGIAARFRSYSHRLRSPSHRSGWAAADPPPGWSLATMKVPCSHRALPRCSIGRALNGYRVGRPFTSHQMPGRMPSSMPALRMPLIHPAASIRSAASLCTLLWLVFAHQLGFERPMMVLAYSKPLRHTMLQVTALALVLRRGQ